MASDGRVGQSITPFSRDADGEIVIERPRHTTGGTSGMFWAGCQRMAANGGSHLGGFGESYLTCCKVGSLITFD